MRKQGIQFIRLLCAVTLAGGLAAGSIRAADLPPLIPLEDFFKNPSEAGFELSPSGEKIAFVKPWNSRMNVYVQNTSGGEATRVTDVTERDIAGFAWANDERIVYLLDSGGDENFHVYATNLDGSNKLDLTPHEETRAQIVDILKHDPKHLLVSHNQRDKRAFDVYRVDVDTGEAKMILENPGNIMSYLTDHDGNLRIAISSDGVNVSILYRETEDDELEPILTTDFRSTVEPLAFTYDNKQLYASSNLERDKQAIVVFDPVTKKETEVIFEHPQVDVSGLLRSDKRKKITGASFVAIRRGYRFFDEERKSLQEFLEFELPGVEVGIASSNLDEDKYLVRTSSDLTRGAYYFYDTSTKELRHLSDISPWIKPEQMTEMKPVVYQARDGFLIHGYLTLPKGVEAKNLPVVVLPHGGPWARDHWGFRPDAQFLANRGYAVFQMNFRGSTGYGRKFWEASFKEWGKSMQDDITDGVQWLIDAGIADPERIGIYGGSYGGYAVLAGLAFTPELYACGVDYVGVANLFTLLETIPPYWEPMRQMLYAMVGHPEEDAELFRAISPVFHADKIRAPLFIAQGANDPRVKKAESDQMVEAMRKRGIEAPYLVKDNEGHGFRNEENRFEFYRGMEQFLAQHLGGRSGDGADVLGNLKKEADEEGQWVSLFNGMNLDGWEQKNGTATYRVEDGVIAGKTAQGSPNSFLCSTRDYSDFELEFEVKVDKGLNSGVQIRSRGTPELRNGRVHGPQVEIESGPGEAGYIYSEGTGRGWLSQDRSKKDAFKNDEWNHFRVRAVGPRIQTWVNGEPIADLTDEESFRSGFIGLQVHGIGQRTESFEVRWRNIKIRELEGAQ